MGLNFKVDTGTEVTAISEAAFQSLSKMKLLKPRKILYGTISIPLYVMGQVHVTLKYAVNSCQQLSMQSDWDRVVWIFLPIRRAEVTQEWHYS